MDTVERRKRLKLFTCIAGVTVFNGVALFWQNNFLAVIALFSPIIALWAVRKYR